MASAGLDATGFSESSQVSMYNTYQMRVATARETFNRAVLAYDNSIQEAKLQNNAILAEIAYQALQEQLSLSLEGFQYKNQLILEQATKKAELDNAYYQRYLDVPHQINHENAMAEEMRQFDKNYQLQTQQLAEEIRQFDKSYDLQMKQFNEEIRQFSEEIARLKKKDEQEYQLEIKNLELKKKQMEQEKKQWEAEMAIKREQLELQKKQAQQASIKKSGGSTTRTSSSGRTHGGASGKITEKADNGPATPTVNMDSVIALGYGPISASRLASLEASGAITKTVKNGQYYYKNTAKTSKLKELYDLR
jgi:DNA polymerase III alpha subunit (gram-positive type)